MVTLKRISLNLRLLNLMCYFMGTGEGSGPWTPRKDTTLFSIQVQSSVFLLAASVFLIFSIKIRISRFSLSFIPA